MQCALVQLLCLIAITTCDGDQYPDDWLDPNDMVNFDPVNMKMVNKHKKSDKESPPVDMVPSGESDVDPVETPSIPVTLPDTSGSCDIKTNAYQMDVGKTTLGESDSVPGHTEYLLFRQYVRFLVKKLQAQHIDITPRHFDMNVKLSLDDMNILSNFAKTQTGAHDAHHILTDMLVRISPTDPPPAFSLDDYVGISLSNLVQVLVAVVLAVLILRLAITIHLSWQRISLRLFILLFFISIPWTWYHEYKKAMSQQHATLVKEAPSQCHSDQSNTEMALHWLRSTFTLRDDPCKAYYEKLLVDPIWTINPAEALAMTVVRFFIKPLGHIGQGISSFIRGTLSDLPVQLWPFLLASTAIIIILILFMSFGYSLRMPFFISVEPSNALHNKRLENDFKKMIEHSETQSKQIKELLEAVQPMKLHHTLGGSYSQPETLQHSRVPHSIQQDMHDGGDAAFSVRDPLPNLRESSLPMIAHKPAVVSSKSASDIPCHNPDTPLEKATDLPKSASCQQIEVSENHPMQFQTSRTNKNTLSDSIRACCDVGIVNGDQAGRSVTENLLHIESDIDAARDDSSTAFDNIEHSDCYSHDANTVQTLGPD